MEPGTGPQSAVQPLVCNKTDVKRQLIQQEKWRKIMEDMEDL